MNPYCNKINASRRLFTDTTVSILVAVVLVVGLLLYWIPTFSQPVIDMYSFRQSQTALSSLWFDVRNPLHGLFYYKTPVFGEPWMTPFEFPLFQGIVALISYFSGFDLTTTGRATSAFFFLASLIPIWILTKQLGLGLRFFLLSLVLLLASPIYLYWSRSFLIESTAVFFGFTFLSSVSTALYRRNQLWWYIAGFCGVICAVVKITTFPSFALAAMGLVILHQHQYISNGEKSKLLLSSFITILVISIAIAVAILWTRHADSIKALNPISSHLISSSLESWNFGTVSQRLTNVLWWDVILCRIASQTIGSGFFLLLIPLALLVCRGRDRLIIATLILLFLIPILIFSNLHIIHFYYQYANAFWLIFAISLSVTILSRTNLWYICPLIIAAIIFFQLMEYRATYYRHTLWKTSPAMEVAKLIEKRTPPDSAILVVGEDWSPEIAFFAKRKALYIPKWSDNILQNGNSLGENALLHPELFLGATKLGAIVINQNYFAENKVSKRFQDFMEQMLNSSKYGSQTKRMYSYDIVFTKTAVATGKAEIIRLDYKK